MRMDVFVADTVTYGGEALGTIMIFTIKELRLHDIVCV